MNTSVMNTPEIKDVSDYGEEPEKKSRFIIFDGHAIIYRAYHAFKELSDSVGTPINAVYGFTRIMLKVIHDSDPEYVAVAFDHRNGKAKRVESYEKYKAHRPPMPDDLKPQIDLIKEMVTAFNIPQFEIDGFEADDILGTIARLMKQKQKNIKNQNNNQNLDAKNSKENKAERESRVLKEEQVLTTIVTGDKDILQLVDDGFTTVFIPGNKWTRDTDYDEAAVIQKMKVRADQIVDLKALMGDPSDNIPGVKGVGAKTASKLIQEFNTLEEVYKKVDELELILNTPKIKLESKTKVGSTSTTTHSVLKGAILKKMIADKKMAFLSQDLARILLDAPVDFDLKKCLAKDYNKDDVLELFEKYNFDSLKRMLPKSNFEILVQDALF